MLDEARGPLLGFEAGGRPERVVTFVPGSFLVLFTDGLVERRGEIIDTGLAPASAQRSRRRPHLIQSTCARLSSSNHFRAPAATTIRPFSVRSSPNTSCP